MSYLADKFRTCGLFLCCFISFFTLQTFAAEPARLHTISERFATHTEQMQTASDSAADLLLLPSETATSPLLTTNDPFTMSLGILSSLAIVIALIFAVAWLLQRRRTMTGSLCGRILGILPIDTKHFIYVVDVLGRVLVLGVTEQQISMLTEITDKQLIDSLRIQPDGMPALPGIESLMGFLKRKTFLPDTNENESQADSNSQQTGFVEHTEKARKDIRRIEELLIKRNPPQN